MIRGTAIHEVMEYALTPSIDVRPIPIAIAEEAAKTDYAHDTGVQNLSDLLQMMSEDHNGLNIISLEEKIVVYDEDNEVELVGMIDGLFRHPDGGVMIVELKTGNVTSGKMSKFRKELAFYHRILTLSGRFTADEITHYCVIAPDCEDEKLANSLLNQKRQKRDIYLGNTQGIVIVEPIATRSLNGMAKNLEEAVVGMKQLEVPMKWNDYFCNEWCDYSMSCSTELTGGGSVITL
jgi:RecB family exonuclease